MSRIGVGVVGAGTIGKCHAGNLRYRVPEADLVAIADTDCDRARQVCSELQVATCDESLAALLDRKDIQAVVIASPTRFHPAHIQSCAEAGKDILCEKPLALTLEAADAALQAVADAGVILQIGHMRRYDPAYADARQRIAAGEIGDPIIFKSLGRDPEMPHSAYRESGLNGKLFVDSTIHEFDLARWLMNDEIVEVQSLGTATGFPELARNGDVAAGLVNLRFAHGSIGNVETFRQATYGYDVRTEIVGSRGTLLIGQMQKTSQVLLTRRGAVHEIVEHFLVRFADAYLNEVCAFVHAVQKRSIPGVTGQDGRRALAVALAAQRSLEESSPVTLSGDLRQIQSSGS
jgi:inositol 2-dehydrogenase